MVISAILLGVVSCKKEEEKEKPFSLVGKSYSAYAYRGGGFFNDDYYDVYRVYRFVSETEVEKTARKSNPKGGIIGDIDNYTYTLDYPTITIKYDNGVKREGKFIDKKNFRFEYKDGSVDEYTLLE